MYRPAVTVSIHTAIRNLHSIKLHGSNTLKYCEDFTAALRDYRTAVEQHCSSEMITHKDMLEIPQLHIYLLFEGGVEHAEWLRPWRLFNKPEKSNLEAMITSLRRQEPPKVAHRRPSRLTRPHRFLVKDVSISNGPQQPPKPQMDSQRHSEKWHSTGSATWSTL